MQSQQKWKLKMGEMGFEQFDAKDAELDDM
jgi:hypothetical protein